MSEVFRLADPKDAQKLQDIIFRAYQLIRELGLHWPAATADVAVVEDNIVSNDCYVLEYAGDIVATVTLSRQDEVKQLTEHPFLKWFALDPDFKGRGLGSKLLSWVEEHVIRGKLGASAVTLATAEKHPFLVQMYERRGYERILEIMPHPDDGILYLMKKQLICEASTI